MKKILTFLLLLNFASLINANSQPVNPAHWSYTTEVLGNGEFNILISCTLDDGWHLFSKDYVGISVPATLTFEKSADYELVGNVQEQGELIKEEIDLGSEKELAMYYKGRVVFVQKIKILKSEALVKGSMEYMTCKEVCVPPATFEFEIKLPVK